MHRQLLLDSVKDTGPRPKFTSYYRVLNDRPDLQQKLHEVNQEIRTQRQQAQRAWEVATANELITTAQVAPNVAVIAAKRSRSVYTAAKRALDIERLLEQLDSLK